MKVLQLNTFDEGGGAARAAQRLHRGLQAIGCESRMLVQFKLGEDATVMAAPGAAARMSARLRPHLDALPVRFYPHRPVSSFTPALLPDRLADRVDELGPDVVHLHWVAAGFMQLETLRRIGKPVIWTLHDSWAFTGGCHVPFGCVGYRHSCGACPVLGSAREQDLSRWIWGRKEKAWRDLPITVVTPSRWLASCAASSSLFQDKRIEVIPNGLDLQRFQPGDKEKARRALGLPLNKKLLLFGGIVGTRVPNKGFHLLRTALGQLARKGWREQAELVVLGSSRPEAPQDEPLKVNYLGHSDDDALIASAYAAADVFVAPSLLENLPNTIMEAMGCGTPCVAFDQGGVPDLIDHQQNGYLALPYLPEDLAEGISWVLGDEQRRQKLSTGARRKIEEGFGQNLMARRYADLYSEMVQSGKPPIDSRG